MWHAGRPLPPPSDGRRPERRRGSVWAVLALIGVVGGFVALAAEWHVWWVTLGALVVMTIADPGED